MIVNLGIFLFTTHAVWDAKGDSLWVYPYSAPAPNATTCSSDCDNCTAACADEAASHVHFADQVLILIVVEHFMILFKLSLAWACGLCQLWTAEGQRRDGVHSVQTQLVVRCMARRPGPH